MLKSLLKLKKPVKTEIVDCFVLFFFIYHRQVLTSVKITFMEYTHCYRRTFGIILPCAVSLSNTWHHLLMSVSDIFISSIALKAVLYLQPLSWNQSVTFQQHRCISFIQYICCEPVQQAMGQYYILVFRNSHLIISPLPI